MPIDVQCACGARFDVPDNAAGLRVTCPQCAARVNVPRSVPQADPSDPSLAPAGSNAVRPTADSLEAPPPSGSGVGVVIGVLLVLVVAGAVIAASLAGGLPGTTDELQYLPEDTQVVLNLDAGRIRAHPVLGPLMTKKGNALADESFPAQKVGIAPEQIDRLLVGIRLDGAALGESGQGAASEAVTGLTLCLRSNTEIDEEELARSLRDGADEVTETSIAGNTVYLSTLHDTLADNPLHTVGLTVVRPTVLVAGAESQLRANLEEGSRLRNNPAMASLIGRVSGGSYAWLVAELPSEAVKSIPSPVPLRSLQQAIVQVSGEDPVTAEARFIFGEAQEAMQVNGFLSMILMNVTQGPAMEGITVASTVEENELVLRVEAEAESLRRLVERGELPAP